MEIYEMIFATLVGGILFLSLLGRKGKKTAVSKGFVISKDEFPMASFLAVGYGALRLCPWLIDKKNRKLRRSYMLNDRNKEYATEHWKACLANMFAGTLMGFLMVSLISMVCISSNVDPKDTLLLTVILDVMCLVLPYGFYHRESSKEALRLVRIVDELPNMISKMVIYLNSGVPVSSALRKLAETESRNPLYAELRRVNADVDNNVPLKQAIYEMKERCKSTEMSHFYVILEQNLSKGTADFDLALAELAMDLWREKNERMKRRGADVSQKLLIPTFLQFLGAILVAIVPAFAMLQRF